MSEMKPFDTEELIGRDVAQILSEQNREASGGEYERPEENGEAFVPRPRMPRSKPYTLISYLFVGLFLLLIAYMVYFQFAKRDEILRNPYNRRAYQMAQFMTRGRIISSDNEILAKTEYDGEGNEIRIYPYGRMFAHAVGYASNGRAGIESYANQDLLTSHEGIKERLLHELTGTKHAGDFVVTTLRTDLQRAAYEALGDRNGAVVALDPESGAVLAMVSKPDFDPNSIRENWDAITSDDTNSQLVNRATQGRYPPGSVYKIVTTLSYLRSNANAESFHYDCNGEITVDGHAYHCYNGTAHGEVDLERAFAKSCNCAYGTMGLELGGSALKRTSDDLLFNRKLPNDLISNPSSMNAGITTGDPELVQTAFGQGKTTVSPYHMALITAGIANEGRLMHPYMVESVQSAEGATVSKHRPSSYAQLMTASESEKLRTYMRKTVTDGTAGELSYEDYKAYGKTGTAEYGRGDGTIGAHAWFTGFAESESGSIVVTVLVEDGGSGSATAVPIARSVMNHWYYK